MLLDYFDRIEIIHLPSRTDRLNALGSELRRIGLDICHAKVQIPEPAMPDTANGFASKGVYGNFLSHLDILKRSHCDGLDSVLILEDDAIFSSKFLTQQIKIERTL